MKLSTSATLSASLLCALAGSAMAESMSAADLKKLVPGTYNVSVADSVKALVVLKAGGGISVATNKGEKDTGRWTVSGQKFCVTFKHLLDHKTHCSGLSWDNGMIRGDGFTARR